MKPHPLFTSLRFALLGLAAVTTPFALQAGETVKNPVPAIEPPAPTYIFSGDLGVTVANQYNTRGIIVQNDGVSYQPYLNLYAKFYEGEGFISRASLFVGLWADLSSKTNVAGVGSGSRHFTEFDYGVGLNFQFAKRFSFTTFWNQWTSPADAYGDGGFINNTLSFDDSGLISKNFSFKPYFTFLYDLGGDAPTGLERKTWYFEPGISPNYTFFSESKTPVNVAILAKAGLGKDFYGGEAYGYFAVGPQVSISLGFIPPQNGKWTVSAGYLYYNLGDTLSPITGKKDENLFSFNLAVSF